MTGIVLTADIGTSSLKAAYIDLNGKLLAFCRMAYKPDLNGNVCAGAWERAFADTLENLHEQAPGCLVDAICISGNGPTLTPVTAEGDSLPPLYWHDKRTEKPQVSQVYVSSSFFLPHAAWFKKNASPLYEKTQFFISSHEWLAFRLGAEPKTVLPSAAYKPYYWDEQQCDLFGLDREKFPPYIKMGEVMGQVSKDAASRFCSFSGNSLKSGTPIIAGGPDFITALIGTGTGKPGDVCDRAGSSEGINACAAAPLKGEGFRLLPHAVEGLWNIGIVIESSGRLFDRYRTQAGLENISYEELLKELIPSPGDTGLFQNLDFSPLAASHPSLDTGRAVLCAIGFSVRSALGTLAELGYDISVMRVSGGQSKNRRWNQLKADITGVSLMVPEISDGELAGNAVLAALAMEGSRETDALKAATNRMIRFGEVYEPQKNVRDFWENRYGFFSLNNNAQHLGG